MEFKDGIFERIIPLGTRGTGQSPQRTVHGGTSSNLAGNSSTFFLPPLPLPLTFPHPQSSFIPIHSKEIQTRSCQWRRLMRTLPKSTVTGFAAVRPLSGPLRNTTVLGIGRFRFILFVSIQFQGTLVVAIMARSIPRPPRPAGHLSGIFHFTFPTMGHLPKKVSPGVGYCRKQLGISEIKSSIWFHSNICKYLHNCFHLRTRDDRKKNVHGTEKVAVLTFKERFELLQIL